MVRTCKIWAPMWHLLLVSSQNPCTSLCFKKEILAVLNPLKKLYQSSIIFDFHIKSITFFAACKWKCPKEAKISKMTTESQ